MNTSLLRMRKAIAAFTIGTLLASFLAVPAAFAAGVPEWAMEGANAYLKAETREMGNVAANKCEVAKMIVTALDLQVGENEMQAGAAFQDLQGGMSWCQGAAGAVAVNEIATGNNGLFGAEGSVSRAVVATMLKRAYSLDTFEPATLSAERQAEFAGMEWAQNDMAIAVAAGLIQGDDQGRLNPAGQASKWAVATMLYRAANMGAESTTPATPATPAETTPAAVTPEVAPTGGALTVSLSDNTPSLDNLGSDANQKIDGATIAVFELTAGSDDVRVNAIKLHEIGGNAVFGPIALFDADGMRISREKSFNNDKEANVSLLNGGLTIPARSSVELYVRATIDNGQGAATAALAIESPDDISSNASSVSVSNATTELARIVQVSVAEFTVKTGGATPDVSVGDRNVQVARFEMEAGTEDMMLYSITLEQTGSINSESEMSNFRFEIEGQEVATAAFSVDDYVSFILDTPYLVEEDDTVQARVYADILDGAGDNISFSVESDLDVQVMDQAVKQPAYVTAEALSTNTVNVEAGELTIVGFDAAFTEFSKNQNNLVLGYVDVTSKSGEQIELQNINLLITGSADIDTALDIETIEAVTSNGTYDLSVSADNSDADGNNGNDVDLVAANNIGGEGDGDCKDAADTICRFSASNIDLIIDGTQRIWFRADSLDSGFTPDVDITPSLESMVGGANQQAIEGLYFKEVENDTVITDITPSNVSFETVTSKDSTAEVRSKAQSASKTAVQGTDDVVVMAFEIEAGQASFLDIDDITIMGAYDAGNGDDDDAVDNADFGANRHLSSDHVDSARLYHTAVDSANLLDEQGGGEFAAGLLEFDLNDYRIEAGATTSFYVVFDLADNDDVNNDYISVAVGKATIRDMENETVALKDAGGLTMDATAFTSAKAELSRRTVLFASAGTLSTPIDNSDSKADRATFVLAGQEAIVASLEITAQNEDITIEDFVVTIANATADQATAALSDIILVDSDMNELARKSVSGTTVSFENANVVIPEGTGNYYLKVVSNEIGQDKAGEQSPTNMTLELDVTQARGQKLIADGDVAASGASNEFGIVPVRIADVSFVSSHDGVEVSSILDDGENNVLILKVDNDVHTTTQTNDGSGVDTKIDFLELQYSATNATINNHYIERIGNAASRIESEETDIVAITGTVAYQFANVDDNGGALDELQVEINGVVVVADALTDGDADGNVEAAAMKAALDTAKDDVNGPLYGAFTTNIAGDTVTITAARTLYVNETTNANVNAVAYTNTTENQDVFHMIDFGTDANLLEAGQSVYYLVTLNVAKGGAGDNDDSVQVGLTGLDSGSLLYRSDSSVNTNNTEITDLRLSKTRLSNVTLSESRNSLVK